MTCSQEVTCPDCGSNDIGKAGYNANGVPRYHCHHVECSTKSFMLQYRYRAYEPGVKKQLVDMAINRSGIRNTARVLGTDKNTVISTLKKDG